MGWDSPPAGRSFGLNPRLQPRPHHLPQPHPPAFSFKINRSGIWPIFRRAHQARAHRILAHVSPFLAAGFRRPQEMIEERSLPKAAAESKVAPDHVIRPRLPVPHRRREGRGRGADWGRKEMHVVWHDHVPADAPAAASGHLAPFREQDRMRRRIGQQRVATGRAGREEVDRMAGPNLMEAAAAADSDGDAFSSREGPASGGNAFRLESAATAAATTWSPAKMEDGDGRAEVA